LGGTGGAGEWIGHWADVCADALLPWGLAVLLVVGRGSWFLLEGGKGREESTIAIGNVRVGGNDLGCCEKGENGQRQSCLKEEVDHDVWCSRCDV